MEKEKSGLLQVHPSATELPLVSGEAWQDFKASILATGGNLEPVVFFRGQVLDGRNRARAIEELKAEGHSVQLQTVEWDDQDGELPTEFILRVNLLRRHLTDEQRVAIALKLQPQIQIEVAERQSAARIQPGECRNPHGRRGKPEKAETEPTPPSAEERRERNRLKEARSTAGQVAKVAGVTTHRVRQVIRARNVGGQVVLEKIASGEVKAKDVLGASEKRQPAPDPQVPMEFQPFVRRNYRRLLNKHPAKDQATVRACLLKLIRADQKKSGEKKRIKTLGPFVRVGTVNHEEVI